MISTPVVDLFAGPGGLSEGFTAFQLTNRLHPFKISLSIEKDIFAYNTLKLRSFFRQFEPGSVPLSYYKYLQRKINIEDLYKAYSKESQKAEKETWHATLGEVSEEEVNKRIREVTKNDDRWLLIGGPPCQAYSLAGRSRIRGADRRNNTNNYETDKRHFLYREYLRILAISQPPVFILENVKGLLSSKINGENIFNNILKDLTSPQSAIFRNKSHQQVRRKTYNYNVYSLIKSSSPLSTLNGKDFVIESECYGIPQARHRVILLGIRSDIKVLPDFLFKQKKVSLYDTIADLPKIRSKISKDSDNNPAWQFLLKSIPRQNWFAKLPAKLRDCMTDTLCALNADLNAGDEYIAVNYSKSKIKIGSEWFFDKNLEGYCNHASRSHIKQDLYRYFFASCFAMTFEKTPTLYDFPRELYPDHKNVADSSENEIIFSDRFRVQLKDKPSTTIVSHISKDGHYFIHPDPAQCRSLTVREAARLQTFPDNYFFEGPRTEQYHQVGNAVPPLLAKQIAGIVWGIFEKAELI